jgi:hypothetical protein
MAGISATIKTGRKGLARGVERQRERPLRIVPDSGAQLCHHAGKVLLKGMSSEKHFSLPERQKYFPASSPRHTADSSSL